jgi:hypothetical protein
VPEFDSKLASGKLWRSDLRSVAWLERVVKPMDVLPEARGAIISDSIQTKDDDNVVGYFQLYKCR